MTKPAMITFVTVSRYDRSGPGAGAPEEPERVRSSRPTTTMTRMA